MPPHRSKDRLRQTALLSLVGGSFLLGSCTVYLRDLVQGTPWKRGYQPVYDEAIASGSSPEEAHRRALLHAQETERTIKDRRRKDEEDDKAWDRLFGKKEDDDKFKLKWD